jgi:hypothetical protein
MGNDCVIPVFGSLIILSIYIWVMMFGGMLYPEDRIITVETVNYHSNDRYVEIRITDTENNHYVYSINKHYDNPMHANINNGWNFPHERTIETGGKYRITLWHSIFMGAYVKDNFSNWNPNPEISKIIRLD